MTDAARSHEFAYEQTDIPAGMTVRDWRMHRARRRTRLRRWSRIIGALPRSARGLRGTAEVSTAIGFSPVAAIEPPHRRT